MQAFPDQYAALLAHELAHLQFAQRTGALAMIKYLQRRDPDALAALVDGLETGARFRPALEAAYGQPLAILWRDFQTDLRKQLASG